MENRAALKDKRKRGAARWFAVGVLLLRSPPAYLCCERGRICLRLHIRQLTRVSSP